MSVEKIKSEYDIEAENFLEQFGLEVVFRFVACDTPKWDKQCGVHNHYKVTVRRKDNKKNKFSFDWWDSIRNTEDDIKPTAYDVLSSVSSDSYIPKSFEDFCANYGHDEDSRKAHSIYLAVDKLARKINGFFTEEELEGLRGIQ